jgi:LPXTG-site transpeptidase (sortase) family protein
MRLFKFILIPIFVCTLAGQVMADNAVDLFAQVSAVTASVSPLDALAISPDGTWLASGGRDNKLRLWHFSGAISPEPRQILTGHTGRITSLAFNGDSSFVASASVDQQVRLWDVASGQLIQAIAHHEDVVTSVVFSPDGRWLATGSRDATIAIHDVQTGQLLASLDTLGRPVWSLAFQPMDETAPDKITLASGGEDGSIWLWGLGNPTSVQRLTGHDGPVMSLAFSADGQRMLSGGMDGLLRLWNMRDLSTFPLMLRGHLAPITAVSFALDDALLLSTSLDGSVRAWDSRTGDNLSAEMGSGLPLTALAVYENQVGLAGTEGKVTVWQLDESALVAPSTPQPRPSTSTLIRLPTQSPPTDISSPRISIPVVGITSAVTQFPIEGTTWAIDPWESLIGHFYGTAWFDQGNTVLGAHSRYPDGTPGLFYGLYGVSVGDVIIVNDKGAELRYVVTEIRSVNYQDLSVVYPTSTSRLTLITCDIPSYDETTGLYDERLVVIAERV